VNVNSDVQLYDGISSPLANVCTSACTVPPMVIPRSLTRDAVVVLISVPAAGSQLTDADILAPGFTRASSPDV